MTDDPTQPSFDLEAIRALHEKNLDFANEHDPASPFYRRPDIVQKYRASAEKDFQALCARHGVDPTAPKPPVTAAQQHEEDWSFAAIPEALEEQLSERIAALPPMTAAEQQEAVAKMQLGLGAQHFARLQNTVAQPKQRKDVFIAEEGAKEHAELVRLARIACPAVPARALLDTYVLRSYANYGRAIEAKQQHRPR